MTEASARQFFLEQGENVSKLAADLHRAKTDLFSALFWLGYANGPDPDTVLRELPGEFAVFSEIALQTSGR